MPYGYTTEHRFASGFLTTTTSLFWRAGPYLDMFTPKQHPDRHLDPSID